MDNIIQETFTKLKELGNLFQSQRQIQLLVLAAYLMLWLFTSGRLSTTIWVGVGVGVGWMIGRGSGSE